MTRAFRLLRTAGALWAIAALAGTLLAGASEATPAPISLDATLTPFLSRYELPALAAAVVKDGQIVAAGAVGTRKAGANLPVTLDDRFHLYRPFGGAKPGGAGKGRPRADFAGPVEIGGGRKMYLECRGSGSPTVVFISGEAGAATA